ncbi:hypothetical protein BN1044_04572 [Hafnia alvei]|uniref:Uncharacterized protein n=1 Tax=Hafnia alvei TaxID=569 RepID=A0A1C6Z7L3_HAFAL|nr:hypothetical protein BN1044_04572 [Hafnia alvei]
MDFEEIINSVNICKDKNRNTAALESLFEYKKSAA